MLKDVLAPNLDVVFCGTAKGRVSAMKGFYYAGPGNKFYRTLYVAGFTPVQLAPKDCYDINRYRIGLTDLVHTEFGNDNEIADSSYEVENFIAKMLIYQPKYIAFNSKKSASFALGFQGNTGAVNYGLQTKKIGKSKLFVLPSTSGSASRYWDETHWINLKKLIDQEVF